MKKYFWLLSIAILMVACTGKSEKGESDNDTIVQEEIFDDLGPSLSQAVDMAGETYNVNIQCAIDTAAAPVMDNVDNKFHENAVTVAITNEDGDFYNYVFHKSDFAPYIKNQPVDRMILQGMNFVSAENARIHLSAGVNEPGATEGGVNFSITIFSDGHHEIEVDLTQNESGE